MEAAGIIALVRAASSTCVQARTLCLVWKDAPRDVFHLRDELQAFKTFYESIQAGIIDPAFLDDFQAPGAADTASGNGSNRGLQKEALRVLLTKGKDTAESLGEILVELIGENLGQVGIEGTRDVPEPSRETRAGLALRKKLLWLRRLDTVRALKKMLRDTTNDIALCLTILNVQITAVTAHGVQKDLGTMLRESESTILRQVTESTESSRRAIEGSIEKAMLVLETNLQSRIDQRIGDCLAEISSQRLPETNKIRRSEDRPLELESSPQHPLSYDGPEPGGQRDRGVTSVRFRQRTRGFTVSRSNRSSCMCLCYSGMKTVGNVQRWEVPWLQRVLGAFGISYSGFTFNHGSRLSNTRHKTVYRSLQCGPARYTWLLIQYKLPDWLARAVLSVHLFHYDSPELLIRISRLIPTSASSDPRNIMSLVYRDDLTALKSLLASSPSAVHDRCATTSDTALIRAVAAAKAPVVELLLRAGADPFHENSRGNSAVKVALMSFYGSRHGRDPARRKIMSMMPTANFVDQEAFTPLHIATLGLLSIDLATALKRTEFKTHIGSKTVSGLTSLYLAAGYCVTGNEVQLLLEAGEDPNAASGPFGTTPLFWACLGSNYTGARALLAAGASPEFDYKNNTERESVLHAAAQAPLGICNRKLLDLLLEPRFKVDLDAPNIHQTTPAMAVAGRWRNPSMLRYLIKSGANVSLPRDYEDNTALHYAILNRCCDAVRILLGVDEELGWIPGVEERYRAVNRNRRWGIMHFVARYGNRETMRILSECGMVGVPDPSTFQDVDGNTAVGLFNERVGFEVAVVGPDPPEARTSHAAEGGGEQELPQLVRAWKILVTSVNLHPVEGRRVGNRVDEGEQRACYDQDREHMSGLDDGISDDDFFDALET